MENNCENCLYYRECDGGCMLEILEGSDPEECRSKNCKWFEGREE